MYNGYFIYESKIEVTKEEAEGIEERAGGDVVWIRMRPSLFLILGSEVLNFSRKHQA